MSTCKDCLYRCMCYKIEHYGRETETDKPCEMFKPEADYAPVVRCGECKHWERLYYRPFVEPRNDGRCKALWQFHDAERNITFEHHFCSYGERKESEVRE